MVALREHQVAGLDVAVDHPLFVGVLQAPALPGGCSCTHGQPTGAFRLHQLGKVITVDVFHREDDAIAQPERVYAVTMLGWRSSARANLSQEPVGDAGLLDDVPAHYLEHFVAAHQQVLGR